MEEWTRIGDLDFAAFGRHTLRFRRSDDGAPYAISVDDANQDEVLVAIAGVTLTIDVDRKDVSSDGVYRLCGGIGDRTDMMKIGDYAWAELVLTRPATVSYWGAGVVMRIDIEE